VEFAPGVSENLKYYVYQLLHPVTGDVLYVGKGIGGRMFAHAAWASVAEDEKSATIMQIRQDCGCDPGYRIVAHDLTEESAFLVEAVLIEQIGLHNLLNRVRGYGHDKMMLSIADINARYSAGTVMTRDIKEPTLFVSLNGGSGKALVGRDPVKGTRRGTSYWDIRGDRVQLQNRTLGIWKVDSNKANKIKRVAGVFAGIVRTSYIVSGWSEVPHPTGPRKLFKLVREEAESPLIGSRVLDDNGKVITAFLYGKEKAYVGL
jgi:hypothetical protein